MSIGVTLTPPQNHQSLKGGFSRKQRTYDAPMKLTITIDLDTLWREPPGRTVSLPSGAYAAAAKLCRAERINAGILKAALTNALADAYEEATCSD